MDWLEKVKIMSKIEAIVNNTKEKDWIIVEAHNGEPTTIYDVFNIYVNHDYHREPYNVIFDENRHKIEGDTKWVYYDGLIKFSLEEFTKYAKPYGHRPADDDGDYYDLKTGMTSKELERQRKLKKEKEKWKEINKKDEELRKKTPLSAHEEWIKQRIKDKEAWWSWWRDHYGDLDPDEMQKIWDANDEPFASPR